MESGPEDDAAEDIAAQHVRPEGVREARGAQAVRDILRHWIGGEP